MTDLQGATTPLDGAAEAAAAAARAAGVTVRGLTELADLRAAAELLDGIWRRGSGRTALPVDLLRALTKAGNYVTGAFGADGRLAGACVGFFGEPPRTALYSHITGVAPGARGRGVGFALKLHQRAWALDRGVVAVSWTFDPLVGRNAHFNLAKLGAHPVEYLPDFYGPMHDDINRDDDSDRLLVRWQLDSDAVQAACAGRPPQLDLEAARAGGLAVALAASTTGAPVLGPADAPTVLVGVPTDVEAMRSTDPQGAKRWRVVVRDVLGGLLARGASVTGFDRQGGYVLATGDAAADTRRDAQ